MSAAELIPPRPTLPRLREAAGACTACPLWKPATQTVFGEGPARARMMLVGEQPGDREDVEGRPFVGPASRELARGLEAAGIERARHLPDQRRQALQAQAARQASHPPEARRGGDPRLPSLAGGRARGREAGGAGVPRRGGGPGAARPRFPRYQAAGEARGLAARASGHRDDPPVWPSCGSATRRSARRSARPSPPTCARPRPPWRPARPRPSARPAPARAGPAAPRARRSRSVAAR